jgi:hypothetical protein
MQATASGTSSTVGPTLAAPGVPADATLGQETRVRETHDLIASDKVEGTAVRRPNGDRIGQIDRVMIDKRSGQVAYAVMSFGGFLGIGADFYPVPWSKLRYNEQLDAYELDVSDDQLRAAPHYTDDDSFDWNRQRSGRDIYDYYGVTPYWGL